jgi:hypothetical protein
VRKSSCAGWRLRPDTPGSGLMLQSRFNQPLQEQHNWHRINWDFLGQFRGSQWRFGSG